MMAASSLQDCGVVESRIGGRYKMTEETGMDTWYIYKLDMI